MVLSQKKLIFFTPLHRSDFVAVHWVTLAQLCVPYHLKHYTSIGELQDNPLLKVQTVQQCRRLEQLLFPTASPPSLHLCLSQQHHLCGLTKQCTYISQMQSQMTCILNSAIFGQHLSLCFKVETTTVHRITLSWYVSSAPTVCAL